MSAVAVENITPRTCSGRPLSAQRAASLYLLWAGTGHPVGRVTVSQAKLRVLQRRAFGLRPF